MPGWLSQCLRYLLVAVFLLMGSAGCDLLEPGDEKIKTPSTLPVVRRDPDEDDHDDDEPPPPKVVIKDPEPEPLPAPMPIPDPEPKPMPAKIELDHFLAKGTYKRVKGVRGLEIRIRLKIDGLDYFTGQAGVELRDGRGKRVKFPLSKIPSLQAWGLETFVPRANDSGEPYAFKVYRYNPDADTWSPLKNHPNWIGIEID